MPPPAQEPLFFDVAAANIGLNAVQVLHRQHAEDVEDQDVYSRLVGLVREMEWTMQDLEDYAQSEEGLDAEALEFQKAARATVLEVRQSLSSASIGKGYDTDGYETEDEARRHSGDLDVSRHTADLHAEPAPPLNLLRSLCCCLGGRTAKYQQLDDLDQP